MKLLKEKAKLKAKHPALRQKSFISTPACMLFGSAAWKCAERDDFIGRDRTNRERNLQYLTNNTRFLIQPPFPKASNS